MCKISFYERFKFSGVEETPFLHYKSRVINVLETYKNDCFVEDIDNVMELYNILQYIKNIDSCKVLTDEEKENFKLHYKTINHFIGKYFADITEDNFDCYSRKVNVGYANDFWRVMCSYKKISLIDNIKFKLYLDNCSNHLGAVLENKEVAKLFSDSIYTHLIENPREIRLLISALLEQRKYNAPILYVKEVFSKEQLNRLFIAYIDFPQANINSLRLIHIAQNDLSIGVDDNVRLRAKRREISIGEELSKSGRTTHINYGVGVAFRDSDKTVKYVIEDECHIAIYDTKWLSQNLDYPTIMNNFIYVFGYVDSKMRSCFPANPNHKSVMLDMIRVKGIKSYNADESFNMMREFFSLQLQAYCVELKKNGINIEAVIKWFFEEYLVNEFSALGFFYNSPSSNMTYLEKCSSIAREIESILKQYRLYSNYHSIDRELFQMSSEHLVFNQLKSMQDKKYLYANSERIKSCIHHLFNDVLMCYSDDGKISNGDNLFEIFCAQKNVSKKLYTRSFQIKAINRLKDLGVVFEHRGNYSINIKVAYILKELYNKQTVCYHYSKSVCNEIEKMIRDGDLVEENTLFSIPEQEYMDYILNKRTFSDGLDLRNKYGHGTNPIDEKENFQDYLEFLKIMILIVIKINEEFCLLNPLSIKR